MYNTEALGVRSVCKYNNHHYWDNALTNKKDVWRSCFPETVRARKAIFVNTVIIDYRRKTLDNNWACHEDVRSLLGFIQYVYLPLAFFYIINTDNDDLLIPVRSTNSFIEYIRSSASPYAEIMEAFISELKKYWELEPLTCMRRTKEFCDGFNAFWGGQDIILHIGVFSSTFEIAERLVSGNDFIEVLEEDIGMTSTQLFGMCRNFYHDAFLQRNFVRILNNRIGCII